MGNVEDLLVLLALCTVVALWLKLTSARERAVHEARRQCQLYGLQLLDESVGLRSVRVRRVDGALVVERGYVFEVSIDGDDREQGRLWMIGQALSGLRLPTVDLSSAESIVASALVKASGNVVPLRPSRRLDDKLH